MGLSRGTFALDARGSAAAVAAGLSLLAALWLSSVGSSTEPFAGGEAAGSAASAPEAQAQAQRRYGRLPLAFEANTGITDRRIDFLSQGPGYSLFLSSTEATLTLPRGESGGTALRMRLQGADPAAKAVGDQRLPGTVNYLHGDAPAKWETAVPTYAGVSYANVYDGVDVRYYGNRQQLEYDFELAAGADPAQIALRFAGARDVSVAPNGDLLLDLRGGTLRERAPVAYQRIGGERQQVDAHYVVEGNSASFALGHYDRSRPLTIDPLVLGYSTYLGGSDLDESTDVAVDSAGSAYITGDTESFDYPTTPGAFDTTKAGGAGGADAFVTKLAPDGQSLVYSTYLGGGGPQEFDQANSIVVDSAGSAYVAGSTASDGFPTTPGAWDTTQGGSLDAFVTKLSPNGQGLVYSTFLGGDTPGDLDGGSEIAIDSAGSAYVTGVTIEGVGPTTFPTTPGAFDTVGGADPGADEDAYATKVSPDGQSLIYSTFLAGAGEDDGFGIAVGPSGTAYVSGATTSGDFPTTPGAFDTTHDLPGLDAYVTRLAADGGSLVYSTFLGGGGEEGGSVAAVDSAGSAYVAGRTTSDPFPTTPGAFDTTYGGNGDGFVTKLTPSGGGLTYSTYLGGGGDDGTGVGAIDSEGNAYVTGITTSSDFPTTPGALDATYGGGGFEDKTVTKLAPNGQSLIYSTFLGGSDRDGGGGLAIDPAGDAYVSGWTESTDFPTTPGAPDSTFGGGEADVVVSKIVEQTTTTLDAKPMLIDFGPPLGVRFGVLTAVLSESHSGDPVGGKTIVFRSGGRELCQATTDANGVAECRLRLDRALLAILAGRYTASFAGDEQFAASSDSAGLL